MEVLMWSHSCLGNRCYFQVLFITSPTRRGRDLTLTLKKLKDESVIYVSMRCSYMKELKAVYYTSKSRVAIVFSTSEHYRIETNNKIITKWQGVINCNEYIRQSWEAEKLNWGRQTSVQRAECTVRVWETTEFLSPSLIPFLSFFTALGKCKMLLEVWYVILSLPCQRSCLTFFFLFFFFWWVFWNVDTAHLPVTSPLHVISSERSWNRGGG